MFAASWQPILQPPPQSFLPPLEKSSPEQPHSVAPRQFSKITLNSLLTLVWLGCRYSHWLAAASHSASHSAWSVACHAMKQPPLQVGFAHPPNLVVQQNPSSLQAAVQAARSRSRSGVGASAGGDGQVPSPLAATGETRRSIAKRCTAIWFEVAA